VVIENKKKTDRSRQYLGNIGKVGASQVCVLAALTQHDDVVMVLE